MNDRLTPFPCPKCVTEAPAALLTEWTGGESVLTLSVHCASCGVKDVRVYTYGLAAKRVGRHVASIKNWARDGMVMGWALVNTQRARVVAEDVLLAWYRDTLTNSPVHQYRLRAAAKAQGRVYVPRKSLEARSKVSGRDGDTERQPAVFGGPLRFGSEAAPGGSEWPPEENCSPEPIIAPVKAPDEYDALQAALATTTPGCDGIDEFTADTIDDNTKTMLASICAACPVIEQCRAFAAASRPVAGYWAGRDGRAWRIVQTRTQRNAA